MPGLELVPIYFSEREAMLHRLGEALARTFRVEVRYRTPWFDPESTFDTSRGQYRSTALLKLLLNGPIVSGRRYLGVTDVDLFTPVLTYVFGEAQLDGRAAIVSLHRLRPELYGLPADENLLFERLEKEAVHELGHTFGLIHCAEPTCVMHASTYAEQVDFKAATFCPNCLAVVRSVISAQTSRLE